MYLSAHIKNEFDTALEHLNINETYFDFSLAYGCVPLGDDSDQDQWSEITRFLVHHAKEPVNPCLDRIHWFLFWCTMIKVISDHKLNLDYSKDHKFFKCNNMVLHKHACMHAPRGWGLLPYNTIRVCASERGRDFVALDLQRDIHCKIHVSWNEV